jgi:hypothetical protein
MHQEPADPRSSHRQTDLLSSLPTATFPPTETTLLKHGTPLQVFPSGIKPTDTAVDLPKLVALIEDLFGKTLDVAHFLDRVNDHITGHQCGRLRRRCDNHVGDPARESRGEGVLPR